MIFRETSPEMMLKNVYSVCYCKKQTGNYFLKIFPFKVFDILQNFYFYRILDSENFKMEVEQMYFVTHLIITVQYIIDYLKTHLLKFGQISFKW